MKTGKTFRAVALLALAWCVCSCISNRYRITTRINAYGSCLREVYAKADSAFLSGDTSHNPFFFTLDSSWLVQPEASGAQGYTVRASRRFSSVSAISAALRFDEKQQPMAAPVEALEKRFRWFFSYYTFTGAYPTILDTAISFSPDEYMSKAEQKIWFQGDFSALAGANGMEMKDALCIIEKKFLKLYDRYAFERSVDAVQAYASPAHLWAAQLALAEVKDSIFNRYVKDDRYFKDDTEPEVNLEATCKMLDSYFATGVFAALYEENRQAMDAHFSARFLPDNLPDMAAEYELLMPGKVIWSNADVSRHDTLAWKVDATRLVLDDYVLRAHSRAAHAWAFVLTALLLLLAGYCLIKVALRC
ncbi:MAG: hypothetical protein LBF55_08100 [Prevotellaceae bacterium]|jgi:hypothetical protein|nr:hypothetical protein [Prevotellaceae bacterium]